MVVILDKNSEQQKLRLSDIGSLWTGETISFWLAPAEYNKPIALGSSGPAVQWVASQFALIDQQTPLASQRFNSALSARVKLFQRDYSLKADGIVGANTILTLNEAANLVPDALLLKSGAQN